MRGPRTKWTASTYKHPYGKGVRVRVRVRVRVEAGVKDWPDWFQKVDPEVFATTTWSTWYAVLSRITGVPATSKLDATDTAQRL